MKAFIFVGAPGVGKGTYAKMINSMLGYPHISIGDIIREEIKEETNIGTQMKSDVSKGKLISDQLINQLITKTLGNFQNLNNKLPKGIIMDGYPRTIDQAKYLSKLLNQSDDKLIDSIPSVINIVLDETVMLAKVLGRRICRTCGKGFNLAHVVNEEYDMPAILPDPMTCSKGPKACQVIFDHRPDDTKEIFQIRMNDYNQVTSEVLKYYESMGCLKKFEVKKGVKDIDKLLKVMHPDGNPSEL